MCRGRALELRSEAPLRGAVLRSGHYRAQRCANVLIVVLRYGASVWTGVELFFNKHKDNVRSCVSHLRFFEHDIAMSVWENNRPEAVLSSTGSQIWVV